MRTFRLFKRLSKRYYKQSASASSRLESFRRHWRIDPRGRLAWRSRAAWRPSLQRIRSIINKSPHCRNLRGFRIGGSNANAYAKAWQRQRSRAPNLEQDAERARCPIRLGVRLPDSCRYLVLRPYTNGTVPGPMPVKQPFF